jgi:hypothetical protein
MNGNENQNAAQLEAQFMANNIQVESSTNDNMTTDDAVWFNLVERNNF